MYDPHGPSLADDAASLANIVLSALVSMAVTGSVLSTLSEPEREVTIELSEVEVLPVEVDAAAGADRIYGRVTRSDGTELTGYLTWNGRESSWADVLQATRPGDNSFSGVRFGHVARMEPIDSRTARVTLKSGDVVELAALMAEGQTALRPLAVEEVPDRSGSEVAWRDVEAVELLPDPLEAAPVAERLHGTLVTRSGLVFTGYVTWDQEKRYLTDLLLGEIVQGESAVPFSDVSSIQKNGPEGALVTLHTGEQAVVGSRDLGPSNRGITVSDPGLGVVVVPWDRFRELRLHPAEAPADYESFDGGGAVHGRVVMRSGAELGGLIRWDRDEAASWDLIDGQLNGIRFRIELSEIWRIRKFRFGAAVDLRDGRSFYLTASQDVSWTNRGIQVTGIDLNHVVPWEDFEKLLINEGS